MLRKLGILLVIAAIGLGVIYHFLPVKASHSGWQDISVPQLEQMIKSGQKLTIIDLREPELYAKGHIPGAISMPFYDFHSLWQKLSVNDTIVFVCHDGPMGEASAQLLAGKGFKKLYNLSGGMAAWTARGGLTD